MAVVRLSVTLPALAGGALWLSACGSGGLYTPPALLPPATPVPQVPVQSGYVAPTPSPSPTPYRPLPPATGSVLIGTLGSGQLVAPRGLAFAGGSLFVADQAHAGPTGSFGAVLRFDPATGQRQGIYCARSASESLPVDISGVAVATSGVGIYEEADLVYPVTPWAVFGFAAPTEYPLNFGRPFVPGGADVAVAGDVAWVAEPNEVRAFHLPDWLPDVALSPNEIMIPGARGLGVDGQGMPLIVAGDKVYDGSTPFTASGSVPVDPRDVAFDPTSGTLLVLDRDRVLRYGSDGSCLQAFGKGDLQNPVSLAVGDDGSVYVSDAAERQVLRFAPQ